jgi:hypothetical protein
MDVQAIWRPVIRNRSVELPLDRAFRQFRPKPVPVGATTVGPPSSAHRSSRTSETLHDTESVPSRRPSAPYFAALVASVGFHAELSPLCA